MCRYFPIFLIHAVASECPTLWYLVLRRGKEKNERGKKAWVLYISWKSPELEGEACNSRGGGTTVAVCLSAPLGSEAAISPQSTDPCRLGDRVLFAHPNPTSCVCKLLQEQVCRRLPCGCGWGVGRRCRAGSSKWPVCTPGLPLEAECLPQTPELQNSYIRHILRVHLWSRWQDRLPVLPAWHHPRILSFFFFILFLYLFLFSGNQNVNYV